MSFQNFFIEALDASEKEEFKETNKTFIEKRKTGAAKIAKQAEAKGSFSSLTAIHFKAKEKPYASCLKNFLKKEEEINKRVDSLIEELKDWKNMSQAQFQKIMGEIEAYGEVALQLKKPKDY